eukprot:COSAG02_NODE_3001_length_7578_cov_2.926461_4_plen_61_part_00
MTMRDQSLYLPIVIAECDDKGGNVAAQHSAGDVRTCWVSVHVGRLYMREVYSLETMQAFA